MNIMLNLDKRCQEILKRLMYAGGYLKIQDLADEMQISRRSVYYDITKINEWLEDQEIDPLVQERGKGIFVTRKPPVIQVVLKSLSYKKSNKKKKTSDIM